ncbi:alpha/beta fold hydrolase [Nonomuraea angiospora]|uniref:thioesterase II family protein n=1 Tax=Nonomuraea angiospora TaxID=46172 RepID=UPI003416C809
MTPYQDDLWIRRFHPSGDDVPRIVCFPHAGGAANSYHALSRTLSPSAEVLAIQYPGRQDRFAEPCLDDIRVLADGIFERLRGLTDRPLALFGHSMGSVVAFEVAHRLEREGVMPAHLFVSAGRGPACERPERVHLMNDDGVIAEMRRLDGTHAEVFAHADLMRLVLEPLRGDYKAIETYAYGGFVVKCPVTALVGDDDPSTTVDAARMWGDHTEGPFALHVFPGGHFYLNDQLPGVARVLRSALSAIRG